MITSFIKVKEYRIKVYSLNTVVVGTGAAGFNAADRLYEFGQKDIAIVTDHVNAGTSRNTGSDKQTYYKLTLSGSEPDSVEEVAKTLFSGQCVDGDIALCEAALSTQCFLKLVELGVPFPRNRYGEYVGYKTDHDPLRRATSVGPYTSKAMTECIEKAVNTKKIPILDKLQVVKILRVGDKIKGILCLNLKNPEDPDERYVAFNCINVIYATGGPAGMYADSVYPLGHYGSTGLAFEAGVTGKNLTEWQYGLASIKPRWNVSGTYMQVLPKFISTDMDGKDAHEFLFDFFTDKNNMLNKVFLKGYQWPFDVRKIDHGSSIIDILVYIETCMKSRRVFLDFRANPGDGQIDFTALSDEAYGYLEKADAAFGTPIERLLRMNPPAVDFYKGKGVDLNTEVLEIALCAQHNNGGLGIDKWWQTNVEGFFAAGEAAASHGVYRPGGSALNAGQVGSTRAAQYIAAKCQGTPESTENFFTEIEIAIGEVLGMGEATIHAGEENVQQIFDNAARRMSQVGAAFRNSSGIAAALEKIHDQITHFNEIVKISSPKSLYKVYRLYDVLLSQYVYLSAMNDYIKNGGKSRGSALYHTENGTCPYQNLPNLFKFILDDASRSDLVQEVAYKVDSCGFHWRKVREIPHEDDFFENVWRSYRENGNVY